LEEKILEELVDKVTFETEMCGGCRSCELACSFHHAGFFQRRLSSMDVNPKPKELGHSITFYRESIDGHIACDMCKGLDVPLCVQFCPKTFREELEKLLRSHLSAPRDGAVT
jgi:Fe-S-cluster-containing hydrogenase component 2